MRRRLKTHFAIAGPIGGMLIMCVLAAGAVGALIGTRDPRMLLIAVPAIVACGYTLVRNQVAWTEDLDVDEILELLVDVADRRGDELDALWRRMTFRGEFWHYNVNVMVVETLRDWSRDPGRHAGPGQDVACRALRRFDDELVRTAVSRELWRRRVGYGSARTGNIIATVDELGRLCDALDDAGRDIAGVLVDENREADPAEMLRSAKLLEETGATTR